MRDQSIEKIAASMYDSKLPYHNFGHAIMVMREAEKILKKCCDEEIEIDEEAVYYGCLFHDAGYHENESEKGYESKEAYSAALAENALIDAGIDSETVRRAKAAILSTHCDAHCYSNEDKVVRAADLSGMAEDYSIFKINAVKLKHEYELLSGNKITWDKWRSDVVHRVELFLREELDLTKDYFDEEGNSVFHAKVRDNLKLLESDESEIVE